MPEVKVARKTGENAPRAFVSGKNARFAALGDDITQQAGTPIAPQLNRREWRFNDGE